ncbi:TPA: pili assembly chaperone, partial [Escherichia coli]|nr:pili assembly chaperone [Salmonella enterica subsp. enterica serovar Cerro]ECF9423431.1 pili assembly chaperone [Salmonella enterica]ECT1973781.1 pili assembly chaperone [Salmonella enterica subsp. enterica serovar Montevideo]EEW3744614.1 pili assembly chaperone [Escherichia coli]
FSVITCPRKTSLYEKLSIPFVYLLFQWSLPHLHSDGMTVVIRPLQPPHTN